MNANSPDADHLLKLAGNTDAAVATNTATTAPSTGLRATGLANCRGTAVAPPWRNSTQHCPISIPSPLQQSPAEACRRMMLLAQYTLLAWNAVARD